MNFDANSISALNEKRQAQWSKIQAATFLTRNEMRQAAGYPPMGGGDKSFFIRSKGASPDKGEEDVTINDLSSSEAPESWGNPDNLQRHFDDHGNDFNAMSPEDYANQAADFYQRYLDENLPAYAHPDAGMVGVYDPDTNTFGLYNNNETTTTFFKPDEGIDYYTDRMDAQLGRGGWEINPLPASGDGTSTTVDEPINGGRGGSGGAGALGPGRTGVPGEFSPSEEDFLE